LLLATFLVADYAASDCTDPATAPTQPLPPETEAITRQRRLFACRPARKPKETRMSSTSLKLPDELKQRAVAVAQ
jgi:hypothetical protein